jgi:8-oxo-dGTP pyrophosphatase MutT (NUDIX family)
MPPTRRNRGPGSAVVAVWPWAAEVDDVGFGGRGHHLMLARKRRGRGPALVAQALVREMKEKIGLDVEPGLLLYMV